MRAAIGIRVKSGWATAVLVAGSIKAPGVADRRTIELSDPAIPESRQPYHAGMGRLQTNNARVARLRKVVVRASNRSVSELIEGYRRAGHQVRCVALVVGSTIDPARISNPHIRAHALEGQLFRTAVADAARKSGLSCTVIVERDVYVRAAKALGRSEDKVKRAVAELGGSLSGRWRADEKKAALAAWLALT
ncbi:MAG: hypothetical protein ACRDFT_04715 [bacterium]